MATPKTKKTTPKKAVDVTPEGGDQQISGDNFAGMENIEKIMAENKAKFTPSFHEAPSASMSPSSESINVEEYAKGVQGATAAPAPAQVPPSPPPVAGHTEQQMPPTQQPPPASPPPPPQQPTGTPFSGNITEFQPDFHGATEGAQDGQPNMDGANIHDIEEEEAKKFAAVIMDALQTYTPSLLGMYSMIDAENVQAHIASGKLPAMILISEKEFGPLLDAVHELNRKDLADYDISDVERGMIEKPLINVLKSRGIKASPEMLLLGAFLMVGVMKFNQARKNRAAKEDWMKQMIELNTQNNEAKQEPVVEETHTTNATHVDNDSGIVDAVVEED